MKIGYRLAALSALGLLIASPAAADWDGRGSSGDSGVKSGDTGGSSGSSSGDGPSSSGGSSGDGGATSVPEPADFALFAAGVIGLIIGRRSSRARRRG